MISADAVDPVLALSLLVLMSGAELLVVSVVSVVSFVAVIAASTHPHRPQWTHRR